ncbi:TNT domain-containing protein [Micromonospora okii]|uniref:TNT domain-containing protein n=1 Tax=Micromonospora okii TaxID=1182970 RepID=UPI001E567D21|nr:TNT domain-containing protein [Micromonospora okii]
MKVRRWALAALSGAALALAPATPALATPADADPTASLVSDRSAPGGFWGSAAPVDPAQPQRPSGGGLCRPGTPPDAPRTTQFYGGNPLFGPEQLPAASPVGPLLAGYQRFGGLNETEFLRTYGNTAGTGYVYPPAKGYVLGPDGRPIRNAQTLLPGYRLDRFGFPGGAFLAPLGTPFGARSLPPPNLSTPADSPLANYHVYCVVKPFTVDSGPIAPWFAQPGLGTQFELNPAYLPRAGSDLSVTWLLAHGYLVEEKLAAGPCAAPPRRGAVPAAC